jgi:hypothetical protein
VRAGPRLIAFVGPDGSGKSTLARIAARELESQGLRVTVVWSRYNNYLSKPLLALARVSGHSRRETRDGTVYGYHDFGSAFWLRYPFILLQAIDVNLGWHTKTRRLARQADVLVLERSPWDTLADVILDTGCESLPRRAWGRWLTAAVRDRGPVFWVIRSEPAVLASRPDLRHDRSLARKTAIYAGLATAFGWIALDNDRPLGDVTADVQRLVQGQLL